MMEKIIISNKKELDEKIEKIFKDGKEKFHVLADFDRTLTKAFIKKKRTNSIISMLRKAPGRYLTEDYADRANELFDKYYPIEIDPNLSIKKKDSKNV